MNLADLRNDKYRGSAPKLPMCQMLLTKGKTKDTGFEALTPILFVKADSLKLASWVNDGSGKPYTHTYNDGKKETGLAFAAPRINFLLSSPRLIEVTKKGDEAGIGMKGEIIGNFDSPNGSSLRAKYPKEYTTLRTLYMLYLLAEDNNLLHKVPLTLSIHGGGAAFLGKSLDMFYRQLEVAYSESQDGDEFYTLGQDARCLAVFEAQLESVPVGEEQTSDIPAFVGYKEPTFENLESLFNFANADKIHSVQQSLSNFAERYLRQFEQYHPVNNMTELALVSAEPEVQQTLPSFNVSRLPVSVVADDEIPDF